ncbi:MAG: ankyrin repeat domain-containing protein [Candidatus Protochlamydia sp.]|nr:ankyrin repeat domain-containing protein [Candidatus Protochlamydia sp.]
MTLADLSFYSSQESIPTQLVDSPNMVSEEFVEHPDGQRLSLTKVLNLVNRLKYLTLPYFDFEGNSLQLWKMHPAQLFGTVHDKQGRLTIVSADKLRVLSTKPDDASLLIRQLEKFPPKEWHLIFNRQTRELDLWPFLRAAGKDWEIKVEDSPYKEMTREQVVQKLLSEGYILKGKNGRDSYVHPETGDTAYIDPRNQGRCAEPNHVDFTPKGGLKVRYHYKDPYGLHQFYWRKPTNKNGISRLHPKFIPAQKQFEQLVRQKGLTDSYKSANPNNPIAARPGTKGTIGGVACSPEYIEGLFDTPEALFEKDHFFCMPALENGQMPFSDAELRQILRELAIGIYAHSTVPFFSLHFNQNSDLVPIIHPVYKNTLVGRVISMLDYIMKGYLNGGVFQENFVDEWHKHPDWSLASSSALQQMVDFTNYCETNLQDTDKEYFALRKMLQPIKQMSQTQLENPILRNFTGFSNSFRIIAKQNSIQKEGNLFVIDSDFDVFYTINPSPEYREALEEYTREHGSLPFSYQAMLESYEFMCKRIHDHMVKMPLCSRYFSMLSVINFFSGYFSTLKKNHKIPILPTLKTSNIKGSPNLFPHLPLQFKGEGYLKCNSHQIYENFLKRPNSILNACFQKLLTPIGNYTLNSQEKEDLLNQCKTEIRLNIQELCSPGLRRFIQGETPIQEAIECVANRLAPEFLENILNRFADFSKSNKLNFGDIFTSDTPERRQIKIDAFFKKEKLFNDTDINLSENPVSYQMIGVQSECTSEEIELGKRVVGGCGMHLSRQVACSTEKVATIWKNHWPTLLSLKYESLAILNFNATDKDKKVVFRLGFKNLPTWSDHDFSWMESLLVDSEINYTPQNYEMLTLSMQNGDKRTFKELIDSHSVEQLSQMKDRYQCTLLHDAAAIEDSFYFESLIDKGLSQNADDVYGYKPVHYAAMTGAMPQLERLLKTNLNSKSYDGSTPLIVAIQNNRLEAASKLLQCDALFSTTCIGFNPIHCALHQRNLEMIHLVLNYAKGQLKYLNELAEEEGTPLMLACEMDSTALIERLLNMGADRQARRKDGMTACEIAIKRNSKALLSTLLHYGCKIGKTFIPSDQAIKAAAESCSEEIIRMLIELDSFYSYKNSSDDTPLQIAIRFGNISAALAIIECPKTNIAFLNKKNKFEKTAFDLAASYGLWNVMAKLWSRGVKISIFEVLKTDFHPILTEIFSGTSFNQEELNKALLIAAQAGNHEVITKLLIPKGAKVDLFKDTNDWTMIHYLATCNGLFLFKKLVAKTGDLLNPLLNEENKTLPYLAAEYESKDILRFLLEQLKRKNISLSRHYNDRHLFYALIESGNIKLIQMMFDIYKNEPLANLILDENDTRPAHLAAKIGSIEILKLLLTYRTDLHVKDRMGFTPLDYAVQARSEEVISFLLGVNCNVFVKSKTLAIAASHKDGKILQLLAKQNVSRQTVNKALLQVILVNDFKAYLNLLRMCDASLDYVSSKGWTPLLLASDKGHAEIISHILTHQPIDKRYYEGNNALHLAALNGYGPCVQLLVDSGFDPFEVNAEGKNAWELASSDEVHHRLDHNNKLEREHQLMLLQEVLWEDDPNKLTKAFENLPLNENISLFHEGYLISGTPLHFLFRLGKEKSKLLFLELLKIPNLNLNLQDRDGNTLVHLLAMKKNLVNNLEFQCWSEVIKSTGWLNVKNHKGQTILHVAAKYQNFLYLKSLSKFITKDNIDLLDKKGRTALFYAIESSSEPNVKFLIQNGANLRHRDHELVTPLIWAIKFQKLSIVKILLENGADPNQWGLIDRITPLHLSLSMENDEIVRALLNHHVDCSSISNQGVHAVHLAAEKGKIDLLRLFAGKGISLDVKNKDGITPIQLAAAQGKTDLVAALLPAESIAIIERKNEGKGVSTLDAALHSAAKHGQTETMQFLLERHANPETKTTSGDNAISLAAIQSPKSAFMSLLFDYKISNDTATLRKAILYAIAKDNVDSMIALYEKGVTPNLDIQDGFTGLHLACSLGALHCTKWLLQNGADFMHPCASGKNALEIAASGNSFELFSLLLNMTEVDVNLANSKGETLLHLAVRAGNLGHVLVLIKNEAALDLLDCAGRTPLHIAAKEGHASLVSLLLICGANASVISTDNRTPLEMVQNATTREAFIKFETLTEETQNNESRLHLAVRSQNTHALSLLAQIDDLDQQNSLGIAPFHLAVQIGWMEGIHILLNEEAKVDIQDHSGQTPLWYACLKFPNIEIAKALIYSGAESNFCDTSGKSIKQELDDQDNDVAKEIVAIINNL